MKKILIVTLTVLLAISVSLFAACTPQAAELEPPKEVVTTEYLEFTYSKTTNTYTVTATDAGKEISDITIPAKINGYQVAVIADYAFTRNKNLKSVKIEEGITNIGNSAFLGCSEMETLQLPSSLIQIKQNAFNGCQKIQRVDLSDKIKSMGEAAFSGCISLKTVNIPSKLTIISDKLFSNCGLESVVLPDSVKKIGSYAFNGNDKLSEVKLTKTVAEIGSYAFANCSSLTEILFPKNETLKIGDYAFSQSGLLNVYLPSNVVLGTYTFNKLAWDDTIANPGEPNNPGASKCKAIYFESPNGSRGINTFGYTWNRPDLGFSIYVPKGSLDYYNSNNPGDESWARCVVSSVNSNNGQYPVLKEYDMDEVFPDGFPCC